MVQRKAKRFGSVSRLDSFTRGYLEAAPWSSTYQKEEGGDDIPMDDDFDLIDIAPETVKQAEKDCAAFQEYNADDLEEAGLPDEEAGHLFWLNRNGHGVGFWDRPGGAVGKRLSDASHDYGSVDLYVSDDGKVYGT